MSKINWKSNLSKRRKLTLMNLAYKKETSSIVSISNKEPNVSMITQVESPMNPETVTSVSTMTHEIFSKPIMVPKIKTEDDQNTLE